MSAGTRNLLVGWLVAGLLGTCARGQQPPLPAAPVPVPSAAPVPQPAPLPAPPVGQAPQPPTLGQPVFPGALAPPIPPPEIQPAQVVPTVPPAVPPPPSFQPGQVVPAMPPAAPLLPPPLPPAGTVPLPDPGRDGWAGNGLPSKPEGLFLDTELAILFPVVDNKLSAIVTFPNGASEALHVPRSDLSVTVSPDLEVGYHLPDSLGDLLLGYRFLVTDGHSDEIASFGAASVKSRLDINQIDLDYATATYSPLPRYDLKFRLGARIGIVYLDTSASDALNFQEASSYFVGAGPSASIDFERHFKELPELGLFFRLDGAVLAGQVRQRYRDNILVGTPDEEDAYLTDQKTQESEVLTLQAGFIYHPFGLGNDRLRIVGGYQFENWWGVGKINGSVAPSSISADASVTAQGIFLRGEYDF
jgi:hypothetical protein